jgi:hypothetical protein
MSSAPASKNQLCDMALSHMGNYGSVNDIDNPKGSKETTFALWYDVTRQAALRLLIPNFALQRRVVSKKATVPAFGYAYSYEYPADCLKVLGFGEVDKKKDVDYGIEQGPDGDVEIQTDELYEDGLPLRFIIDTEDVNKFTPDFKILFSIMLAANTALPITQKQSIKDKLEALLPMKMSEMSGVAAQENPPVRVSNSKFKQARYTTPSRNGSKR